MARTSRARSTSAAFIVIESPDLDSALDPGVDALELDGHYLFHANRADLLRRAGRSPDAALAYETAIARADNATGRDFLRQRRHELPV